MSTNDKIEFIQFHKPPLPDGDYAITVKQTVELPPVNDVYQNRMSFSVYGPRFSLSPQDIHSVFPPDGSLGEHSNVLPHIILKRSTLPWERSAIENSPPEKSPCWLALLLFHDDEKPTPYVARLRDLVSSPDNKLVPDLKADLESAQHLEDTLTLIDVPKSTLKAIAPTTCDLEWLAHVRQVTHTDEKGKLITDELAVVICNRLPQPSGTSTIHLVSVEGRYGNDDWGPDNAQVRLVSLKSWSFSCSEPQRTFQELLKRLDCATLRLPPNEAQTAEPFLARGLVPLPHFIREGTKTVSWYHGPLIPGPSSTEIELPVRAADQLVRYDMQSRMFDVSYASAWELGRLLALQSNHFSLSLFHWKRQHARELRKAEQIAIHPHLPSRATTPPSNEVLAVPDEINAWFWDLSLLKGLPFNYLVPDEKMLPDESIRFFQLDPLWIECLLDGAFSIGRVSDAERRRDAGHANSRAANSRDSSITGFLLRSSVVSGWPGLLVDASACAIQDESPMQEPDKLTMLRMDRLSPNVLICLFKGAITTVDIHQKPETLHFGLDRKLKLSEGFEKRLRNSDGSDHDKIAKSDIPWKSKEKLVIDIAQLAKTIPWQDLNFNTPATAAEFGLEMIEGGQLVRFCRSS